MKRQLLTTILFLLAALGFMLGQGHVSIPVLGALGGVAALVALRRWPGWLGLITFVFTHTLAVELAYQGTVPLPLIARLGVFMAGTLPLGALYLAQSRATRRRPGLLTTFILPAGWAAMEFAQGALSPTGTWGSLAYGFVKPATLPLAQLAAVTGWIGLTFLVGWTAAMIDLIMVRRDWRPGVLLIAVVAVLWVSGSIRLASSPDPAREITVAMQHGPTLTEEEGGDLLQAHYLGWPLDDEQRARVPAAVSVYQDRMFERLRGAAASGADVVAWSEVLGWLGYDEEEAWVERVRQLARTTGTTFALGLGIYDPERVRPYENKLVVVAGTGTVVIDYLKTKATPGAWHVVGDGEIPAVAMPWGRLGGAICYDFDFPRLLQQAGRAGTQVLLAPSFDDKRVRHMHARMATLRAIEEGVSLVRPTAFGISAVVDPYGRILADKDAFAGGGFVLRASVPVYDTTTLYPHVGDAYGFLCLLGFVVLLVLNRRPAV